MQGLNWLNLFCGEKTAYKAESTAPRTHMDEFYRTELEKALSEQSYGIVAYRIDHEACTEHAAFAVVDLLEEQQLRVELSNRGYQVSLNILRYKYQPFI